MHLFLPDDVLGVVRRWHAPVWLVGVRHDRCVVVVTVCEDRAMLLPAGLLVVGEVCGDACADTRAGANTGAGGTRHAPPLPNDLLHIRLSPLSVSPPGVQLVLFHPPNTRLMEYYTIAGTHTPRPATDSTPPLLEVVDCVNRCYAIRRLPQLSSCPAPLTASRLDPALKLFVALRDYVDKTTMLKIILPLHDAAENAAPLVAPAVARLLPHLHLARQVVVRLESLRALPLRFFHTKTGASLDIQNSNYVGFYNTQWLVINDFLLGLAFAGFLDAHHAWVVQFARHTLIHEWCLWNVAKLTRWLMVAHPGGFKLNKELCQFVGDLVLWALGLWETVLKVAVVQHLLLLVTLLSFASRLGLLFAICLAVDAVRLLTLHLTAFYTASARFYGYQVLVMALLFRLFMGQKRNVLRGNRTDLADYGVDQLLLGTLIFIVLVYLLPSVVAFYLPFMVMHLAVLALEWGAGVAVVWLNSFPLFTTLLRVKNWRRLPGGVELTRVGHSKVFRLDSVPMLLGEVLAQFTRRLVQQPVVDNWWGLVCGEVVGRVKTAATSESVPGGIISPRQLLSAFVSAYAA